MSPKETRGGKRSIFPSSIFLCPRPARDLTARNRLGKKLRKQQNNTAFAKLSYLVNNCEPVSMCSSANVAFVARFSNQIVCFSTKSWDRKRFKSFLGVNGQPSSSMAVDVDVAYLLTEYALKFILKK